MTIPLPLRARGGAPRLGTDSRSRLLFIGERRLDMRALAAAKQRLILVTLVMLAIVGAAEMAAAQASEEGVANFYSDKLQRKKMASGELYDKDKLTASHKKLPYGTKVTVTNLENEKSVVVTINDRMAASNPAIIDVTRRAAEERLREVRQDQGQAGGGEVTSHH